LTLLTFDIDPTHLALNFVDAHLEHASQIISKGAYLTLGEEPYAQKFLSNVRY